MIKIKTYNIIFIHKCIKYPFMLQMLSCKLEQINEKINKLLEIETNKNYFFREYEKNEEINEIKDFDMKNFIFCETDDITFYYARTLFEGSKQIEKIKNLCYLFRNNPYIQTLIFSCMFYNTTLKSLDSFDGMFENTKKMLITDLSYMFKDSLLESNISMKNMFSNSSIYESHLNSLFENTKIKHVNSMYNMFNGDENLKYVNLRNMFEDCVNLKSISINNIFDGNLNETYFNNKEIFKGCNPLHLLIDFYHEDGYKHENYNNEIINKFIDELPDFSYIYIDDKRRYEDFEKYLKDENTNSIIVVDENLNCFKNIIKIKKDILEEYNNRISEVIKKTNIILGSKIGSYIAVYPEKSDTLYDDEYVVPGYIVDASIDSKTIPLNNYNSLLETGNNADAVNDGRTIPVVHNNQLFKSGKNGEIVNSSKCSGKINNCHCKDEEENDIEVDFEVLFQILREKFSYGYIPQMDEENLILSIEISDKKIINSYIEFKINPTPIGEIIKENIIEKQFKIFYD